MMQPLFFQPSVAFAKTSSEVQLPEDANEWPTAITQELYRQAPYISDFEPHVVMDRVDAEQGYGFGHVEIQNKTEIQHGASPGALDAAGVRQARIPVIIRDRHLQPLDLLVTDDSTVVPLTESRLREALFRPQAFDITGRGPGDMSMIGQLYPPYRQNYGFGGGGATMNVGMGKEGSIRFITKQDYETVPLLEAVLPTVSREQQEVFISKFASDMGMRALYGRNPCAVKLAKSIIEYEPQDQGKLASTLLSSIVPTVVQLRKEIEGYSLKTASPSFWLPSVETLDRGQVVRLLGEKIALEADQAGSATLTTEEGAKEVENTEEDKAEIISRFGIYKVQDDQGRHLIGYVFPNLIDTDGTALPIALFTNGGQKAVQGTIAGINVGGGASLFEGPPSGEGCFYYLLPNGRAQASIPMTIQATIAAPEQGGVVLQAVTYDGRPIQVMVQPNLDHIVTGTEGELLVPDSFSWLPLDRAESVHLVESPEGFNVKEAALQKKLATVNLRYGGNVFSVDGFPVDKLAADERHFLSIDDTLFLLGGLGTDLEYAMKKMGEAAAVSAPVELWVKHHIKTAKDQTEGAFTAAATYLHSSPLVLAPDLFKEAASIPDPTAVDTILSLGFLNSQNTGVFISYLPVIDDAQKKMCELLLATRLGLQNVEQGALEKAIKATEEVIDGLKIEAFSAQS